MKLRWGAEALADRRAIYDFVDNQNPRAALALDGLLARKAGLLLRHPEIGRPGRVAGTRELLAHRSYVIIYNIAGDTVRIVRVLHTARQWPALK